MTRTEAVAVIARRLGNKAGVDTQIIDELKLAQTMLEHGPELPWFLLKASSGLVTVANTQTVAVPSDFLREYDETGGLRVLDPTDSNKPKQLEKEDYQTLRNSTWLEETGLPTHYALVGRSWYLFPKPDAVYSLEELYYGQDNLLTTDIENDWLKEAPDLLIASAGLPIAMFLRDKDAVSLFSDMLKISYDRLQQENTARSVAAMAQFMGG